jgi:hypothetical protein
MKRTLLTTIPALLFAVALQATPAAAQRVFVAAQGSDGNPCTFALPCRTFQHAHDVVAANGEIDVLDPAGYGALTISKAISIQGHGFAGISVPFGGTGIKITAGAADAVSLNGLIVDGASTGSIGVQFASGRLLTLDNCVVRNLDSTALEFDSHATTAQALSVSSSYFGDNSFGIVIRTFSSGAITAGIRRSAIYGNDATGLEVDGRFGTGPISVAVTDSVAENNLNTAFAVGSDTGHSVSDLVLTRTTAANNSTGVAAGGPNATLRLTQSALTGNVNGFFAPSAGAILSYGDNVIGANQGNTGTLQGVARQ